ncbi:YPO3983 family protein [Erwinia sp. CGal63]|uniref:YPO3983 family protein n=1 Tax=Erwinia sp. CGal63 TaxID=2919889 RepID=UPI003007F640
MENTIKSTDCFYAEKNKYELIKAVNKSVLPRFTRWKDSVNGLGMSVHGVYATKITLKSLEVEKGHYKAILHYKAQDHFGLDDHDIRDPRFRYLNIFRIWFVLQRWEKYAFKPFLTNMEATITLTGSKR